MKTKGKRPEANADPRYAGKLDDPQGGDATMLMQQVREVMTVNQELTDKQVEGLSGLVQVEEQRRRATPV